MDWGAVAQIGARAAGGSGRRVRHVRGGLRCKAWSRADQEGVRAAAAATSHGSICHNRPMRAPPAYALPPAPPLKVLCQLPPFLSKHFLSVTPVVAQVRRAARRGPARRPPAQDALRKRPEGFGRGQATAPCPRGAQAAARLPTWRPCGAHCHRRPNEAPPPPPCEPAPLNPFAQVPADFTPVINPDEVDAAFHMPLSAFLEPDHHIQWDVSGGKSSG